MERLVFTQHVLSAVVHLGDPLALQDHPLATLLGIVESEDRGSELSRLLIAAIDQLRPAVVGEPTATGSRRFQYLDRRYRQGIRAAQVARELGLSERQARRIHQEAVEALALIVWSKRHGRRATGALKSSQPRNEQNLGPVASASELETEITRLGATPSESGAYLSETIRGAIATVDPLARQHALHLDVELAPSLPLVAIDRAVLRQVLVNLLVATIEKDARRVSVATAAGPDAVLVNLALRFRANGESRSTDRLRCDELLQVASRLVQLQAGAIKVREIDPTSILVQLTLPRLQPATILLVDDNPDTLRLFRRYLAGGAYRTIEAMNGRQAIELARTAQPQAIVLDVMMPSQDGWETLQSLRNTPDTSSISVVICSVLRQRELALSLGACAFLEKPVSRDALLSVLRRRAVHPEAHPVPSE